MSDRYPASLDAVAAWATLNQVSLSDARRRYVQFLILTSIAGNDGLRRSLVFKGGNALDFVLQPNRSTIDLDFSLDMDLGRRLAQATDLRATIESALAVATEGVDTTLVCQSFRQMPPGVNRTFVTFRATVGYALPDEPRLRVRMQAGRSSNQTIPLEISLNEPLVHTANVTIGANGPTLRVATIEDIVGEKLRALLQQPIRNRSRRQDVLDIAVAMRTQAGLDVTMIAEALLAKARDVPVSRAAFRDPDIRVRARQDYAALEATTRVLFIPFDEAFDEVLRLVDRMPIPAS